MSVLDWKLKLVDGRGGYHEAMLGNFDIGDGVRFSLSMLPTCYRRGRHLLLIELADRDHKWGGFDEQDQPMRYYHDLQHALGEAELIAEVLQKDRLKNE